MAYVREYVVKKLSSNPPYTASCYIESNTETTYSQIPTPEEATEALGEEIKFIKLNGCFEDMTLLTGAPKVDYDFVVNTYSLCYGCTALKVAPSISKTATDLGNAFRVCTELINPPTIPNGSGSVGAQNMFDGCTNLTYPVSIPASVSKISYIFRNCTKMTGEMVVRYTSTSYITYALRGTTKPITLYGDKTICEAIAATANNGNASWAAWYDPVPAVTNRGQGSYTTADDITRMVRNGALAVSSYAPARMVYHQGDIVRADEWAALVEAAQTIDSSITMSTNYANLNRIEAAFDSAL